MQVPPTVETDSRTGSLPSLSQLADPAPGTPRQTSACVSLFHRPASGAIPQEDKPISGVRTSVHDPLNRTRTPPQSIPDYGSQSEVQSDPLRSKDPKSELGVDCRTSRKQGCVWGTPGLTRGFHPLGVAPLSLHLVQNPGVPSVWKGSIEWKKVD